MTQNLLRGAAGLIMWVTAASVGSIALAWSAALWAPLGPEHETKERVNSNRMGYVPRTVHRQTVRGFAVEYGVSTETMHEADEGEGAFGFEMPQHSSRAGWPWYCLATTDDQPGWVVNSSETTRSISWTGFASLGKPQPRTMPKTVLWGGMVWNVAVMGLAPWVTLRGMAAGRKWLRIRRSCCGNCGYEMGGLTRCPECGAAAAFDQLAASTA